MAATRVTDLVARANKVLVDNGYVRWPKDELLGWLNSALSALCQRRPDANSVTELVTLAAGTKQAIPAAGERLLTVHRNAAGRPVTKIEREYLDDQNSGWHTEPASAVIYHYAYDDRTPAVFWVYPPANAGVQLEISYAKPAPVVSVSNWDTDVQVIPVADSWVEPLLDYMLYRAFSKDAKHGNQSRSANHYQAFRQAIGEDTQADISMSPNNG